MRIPLPLRLPRGIPLGGMTRNRRTSKLRLWPLLVFAVFFAFFYLSNQSEVPLTGRTQLVDISKAQEVTLGLQSYRQILSQSKVLDSGPEVDFVNRVANRLLPVVTEAKFDWEFKVINSPQANAFALPGGKVAVYTGLLPVVKNDDGLAAVLGHEMAHAVARHGAERMTQQKLNQWAGMAVAVSVGEMEPTTQRLVMGALGVGSQYGVLLPFSRAHESEADYMGLLYLARACFDPTEAPKVWERMAEAGKSHPIELLSTHPSPKTRITQFQGWMNEAVELKKKHCASS